LPFLHVFDLVDEDFVKLDLFFLVAGTGLEVFLFFLLQILDSIVEFEIAQD
jgi:hypothetical protein